MMMMVPLRIDTIVSFEGQAVIAIIQAIIGAVMFLGLRHYWSRPFLSSTNTSTTTTPALGSTTNTAATAASRPYRVGWMIRRAPPPSSHQQERRASVDPGQPNGIGNGNSHIDDQKWPYARGDLPRATRASFLVMNIYYRISNVILASILKWEMKQWVPSMFQQIMLVQYGVELILLVAYRRQFSPVFLRFLTLHHVLSICIFVLWYVLMSAKVILVYEPYDIAIYATCWDVGVTPCDLFQLYLATPPPQRVPVVQHHPSPPASPSPPSSPSMWSPKSSPNRFNLSAINNGGKGDGDMAPSPNNTPTNGALMSPTTVELTSPPAAGGAIAAPAKATTTAASSSNGHSPNANGHTATNGATTTTPVPTSVGNGRAHAAGYTGGMFLSPASVAPLQINIHAVSSSPRRGSIGPGSGRGGYGGNGGNGGNGGAGGNNMLPGKRDALTIIVWSIVTRAFQIGYSVCVYTYGLAWSKETQGDEHPKLWLMFMMPSIVMNIYDIRATIQGVTRRMYELRQLIDPVKHQQYQQRPSIAIYSSLNIPIPPIASPSPRPIIIKTS